MKTLKSILTFLAVALIAFAIFVQHAYALAAVEALVFTTLLINAKTVLGECRLGTPTLVAAILTGTIMKVLRTKVVEAGYISTDFGKTGNGFAPPVKWEQDVISQMMLRPTAEDHKPGDDLTASGTNVKTLAYDVKVAINRAKRVRINLPNLDAVSLNANPLFLKSLEESGIELARAIVADAFTAFNSQNFSQELVVASGSQDFDTLGAATEKLNLLGADAPRYFLTGSGYIRPIGGDPRVASGDYKGQMLAGDPYRRYVNIEGFDEVREFPLMPTNNISLGTCTGATNDFITLVAGTLSAATYPPLANGDRVRFSTDNTLPAGLSANHDYYVVSLDAANDKFKVSDDVGGSPVDITNTGSGTHSVQKFEALNAVAFSRNALHLCVRPLEDNAVLARQLGVPMLYKEERVTDPETGLTLTVYFHLDKSGNLYAAVYATYGFKAGRGLATDATNPVAAALAAGRGTDYQALRIVDTATN